MTQSYFPMEQNLSTVPAPKNQATAKPHGNGSTKDNIPAKETKGQAINMSKPLGTTNIEEEVKDTEYQLPPSLSPKPQPHIDFVHSNPPEPPQYRKFNVFTAGSIEMGKAVQWQKRLVELLSHLPITVCNPRKGHWDQSVTQQAQDESFEQQVSWELDALEQADVICFFSDIKTMSPVSLIELGLWMQSGKVVVCCGDEYWRSGNVHLTSERYGVLCVKTFVELVPEIEGMLKEKGMTLDDQGDLVGENIHVRKEKPKKNTQLEKEKKKLEEEKAKLQEEIDKLQAKLKM